VAAPAWSPDGSANEDAYRFLAEASTSRTGRRQDTRKDLTGLDTKTNMV
jgi:hypothetical protein